MAGASRRPVKRGHAAKAQSRARAPGQSRGPAPGRAVRRVRVGDLSPLLGARAGAARRGPLARGGLAPVLRPGRPRSHAGVARRTPRGGTMSAGSLRRIGVSARLVARDLARNRVAVALLVVIPIVFYGLVAATTGDRDLVFELAGGGRRVCPGNERQPSPLLNGMVSISCLSSFLARSEEHTVEEQSPVEL